MRLVIELPARQEQWVLNRRRWAELMSDPALADLPYRIETNAHGQIVMNPPPSGVHSYRQSQILLKLKELIGGQPLPECPISTLDGVKAVDVGWYSDCRFESVRSHDVFETAPEICVDVLSPSNTAAEIKHKKELYFDAGACEVWLCLTNGVMEFYLSREPAKCQAGSQLCRAFPAAV